MKNSTAQKRPAPLPTFNMEAIAKAEAAVQALAVEFEDWMAHELERLLLARATAKSEGLSEDALHALFTVAHDIKGVGATYDYPLATLMAKSLCRLLETPERRQMAKAHGVLVDAHVDAIRAVVGMRVRNAAHPVGGELLAELERRVLELVSDPD
jgi:chemotaxis protein histidine kinase CheA